MRPSTASPSGTWVMVIRAFKTTKVNRELILGQALARPQERCHCCPPGYPCRIVVTVPLEHLVSLRHGLSAKIVKAREEGEERAQFLLLDFSYPGHLCEMRVSRVMDSFFSPREGGLLKPIRRA